MEPRTALVGLAQRFPDLSLACRPAVRLPLHPARHRPRRVSRRCRRCRRPAVEERSAPTVLRLAAGSRLVDHFSRRARWMTRRCCSTRPCSPSDVRRGRRRRRRTYEGASETRPSRRRAEALERDHPAIGLATSRSVRSPACSTTARTICTMCEMALLRGARGGVGRAGGQLHLRGLATPDGTPPAQLPRRAAATGTGRAAADSGFRSTRPRPATAGVARAERAPVWAASARRRRSS